MNFLATGQKRRGVFENVLGQGSGRGKLAETVSLGLRFLSVKLGLKGDTLLFKSV